MKKTVWIGIAILAALGLTIGWRLVPQPMRDEVNQVVQGALARLEGNGEAALAASGTIQADEIRVGSELGGRIVHVHVRKGQEVQSGEVVAELDAERLLDGLAEAQAAVRAAQADLAVVQAGSRAEAIQAGEAALAAAEAERDGTHAAWQNALQAVRDPQALNARLIEAQTQVQVAGQNVALAQAKLAREQLLRDQKRKGSKEREIADLQVQAAQRAVEVAQADADAAATMLHWLELIRSQPLALIAQAHAAQGRYGVAEQGAASALAQLDDLRAGPTAEEVRVAERSVRLAEAQVKVLEETLARLTLTSPVDGVVLAQSLYEGELAAPAATILTLSDLSRVTLTVYVPVDKVGLVRLDQQVKVTVDSFPGRVFAGQVRRIGDEPEYTPRNVATKEERLNTFYTVEIELSNKDRALKPGMPADATFPAVAQ